jgi:hypothetical protein
MNERAPEVSRVESMHWNRTSAREVLRESLSQEPVAEQPPVSEEVLREVRERIVAATRS